MISRREVLKRTFLLAGLAGSGRLTGAWAGSGASKLKIGACDWSIGKSSDPGAFDVAREIGVTGIQVNLGSDQNKLHLRDKARQDLYLAASKDSGVSIASLAIAELNRVPYKSEPRTEEWVWDAVDVAKNLDVTVILLAFFAANDLRNDDKGKREVIRRLKMVAPKAERMGITLGIESYLSAEEHMEIIQQVGSGSVKVYYDFRNSVDAGYDVIREIRWLGKDAICELHMKENGYLLGKGTLDWGAIREVLEEVGYDRGWMQIEGARPEGADIVTSYKQNLAYLKKVFR